MNMIKTYTHYVNIILYTINILLIISGVKYFFILYYLRKHTFLVPILTINNGYFTVCVL